MKNPRILIIAQTPPPFHGQAIMQQYIVDVKWHWCTKDFVRMNFSDEISEVGRFKFRKITQLFGLIRRVKKLANPQIDLVYYPPGGPNRIPLYRDIVVLFFLKRTSRKVILHFHAGGIDQIFNKVTRLEAAIIRRSFKGADAAIVLSDWLKKEVAWIKPKEIHVVKNGIEDVFDQYRLSEKRNSATSFLFIGNLKKEKGVFTLLEAALILHNSANKFLINFVGAFHTKEEQQKFEEFIERNNLQDSVKYLGVKSGEDKWKEFAIADVFCLPTYETEAMPISILEAMMFQLPVITTNWRAIPDMIQHDHNGLLFEPDNANDLARQMRKLIDSAEERQRMGIQAREDYLNNYTVKVHLRKMEEVFLRVNNKNNY